MGPCLGESLGLHRAEQYRLVEPYRNVRAVFPFIRRDMERRHFMVAEQRAGVGRAVVDCADDGADYGRGRGEVVERHFVSLSGFR